ncbi:helix-turn-helix domain-containing protein [Mesorhizobium sp. YIM 152430]|uniref:helix-turn-helix domain-containing protein n=1 Tax=Mesorhizobium sp. YIM 152430 TaxID=3031761 RepID=UPI0023DB3416|nr:helix-turn-helix domain-containing protein [Mesorhizobium sp. YIM 152430]MDF1601585.1 helix-turn-helix domain-containing protein [Mesorhizobium sp. YIM 152430]
MTDFPPASTIEPRSARLCHNITETSELLGISRTTVRKLIQAGELRAIRIRGSTRITTAEIDRFLRTCEAAA